MPSSTESDVVDECRQCQKTSEFDASATVSRGRVSCAPVGALCHQCVTLEIFCWKSTTLRYRWDICIVSSCRWMEHSYWCRVTSTSLSLPMMLERTRFNTVGPLSFMILNHEKDRTIRSTKISLDQQTHDLVWIFSLSENTYFFIKYKFHDFFRNGRRTSINCSTISSKVPAQRTALPFFNA